MIITIGVIAYNEKCSIGSLLKDICAQSYDHKKIEVILVDSMSTDNTLKIMETFKKNNIKDFYDVQVLSNPKKTQPCGWNVVLKNYKGDELTPTLQSPATLSRRISKLLTAENISAEDSDRI